MSKWISSTTPPPPSTRESEDFLMFTYSETVLLLDDRGAIFTGVYRHYKDDNQFKMVEGYVWQACGEGAPIMTYNNVLYWMKLPKRPEGFVPVVYDKSPARRFI